MPDIWFDTDVALAELPVNIGPLLDDTDGKTIEAAVAFNAPGMALKWSFVTTGGNYTQTAVTPASVDDYYWKHQGGGMYSLQIPASGGASVNNDAEGFGWFTGVATGVKPWRGPVIGFRSAALNDAYIDGGAIIYGEGGAVTFTYTVYDTDGTTPLSGCEVYVSADLAGTQRSYARISDSLGRVTFLLNPGTVYVWRSHPERTFGNPDTEVVS